MGSIRRALWLAMTATLVAAGLTPGAQAQTPQDAAARLVGTIKEVTASNVIMKADTGGEVNVLVLGPTRVVRIAPGQTDLKQATPVQLSDLKAGDRILVRGKASPDGTMVTASAVILMKAEDVAQKQERERQDWDRRGVGGLVEAVDPAAGTVQIKTTGFAGSRTVTIRTSPETIVRRYAPDSPKFDDAVRATLAEVKPGDQLRARGTHNADSSEVTAEETVSGTFRNIAGVVISTDPAANTVTLTDLATKKPVVLKITADSQLHKLPEMLAQRLAFIARGQAGEHGGAPSGAREGGQRPAMNVPQQGAAGGHPGGAARNASLQQMLSQMPVVGLAELHKGDALMIVATSPVAAGPPTIITLVAGVEPILAASPNQGAMLLSPWNLGGGGGEGGPPN